MKKFSLYISIIYVGLLSLYSCMEKTAVIWEGLVVEFDTVTGSEGGIYLRQNDGQNVSDQIRVNLIGAHQSNAINISFEVDPTSSAVAGIHYNLLTTGTVTIPAGSSFGVIDFEVLDDNIEAGEIWTLKLNITSADVTISENYKSLEYSLQISCPSELAGLINYSTVPWCGGPAVTGTVELVEETEGVYAVVDINSANDPPDDEDFSFGAYYGCYGGAATLPGGSLRIQEICGTITPIGSSRWGEVYIYNSVTMANGNLEVIIDWENDYGEAGVTTLTRDDGEPWPPLTN